MKEISILIIAVSSFYLILIAFILIFQDRLIFQLIKLPENHQFRFNVPFEEYLLKTADNEQINVLLFKTQNKTLSGVILYFHGNANNLKRWGKYAIDFTTIGYDVLMVDYRGYGKSSGIPTEMALNNDAELLWNWAKNKFEYTKWIVYGRSLGAAVATYLATKENPDLLILETPFDDLNGAMAASLIPFKLKYKFANKDLLQLVSCKKIIFHGSQDWIVPLSSALRLKPLFKNSDEIFIIPKGGHRNLRSFDLYHNKLRDSLM